MTYAVHPGPIRAGYDAALSQLGSLGAAEALRAKRPDLWTDDRRVQAQIAQRLGWIDAVPAMRPHVPRLRRFGESLREAGFSDVVLLGMGGSSLAAEVLRSVIGTAPGYPEFRVLDSIDPDAVRAAMARPAGSLFLVASKSGSTIEVATLAAEADARVRAAEVARPGSHFAAITDAESPLHRHAIERGYRDVFLNPSDIGGRYSALSLFGLVPAAAMGLDIDGLLMAAGRMADACAAPDPGRNPGLALGALMAAGALAGRDKLSVALPRRLQRLGLWIEQLVAESTGKSGTGILPVLDEGPRALLGRSDRVVVAVRLGGDEGPVAPADVQAAQMPLVTLSLPDAIALGAEFYRWEVATAAAGLLLNVNPFDEPNVRQAKDATRRLLDVYRAEGRLPSRDAERVDDLELGLSSAARTAMGAGGPLEFLRLLGPGDYCALLAYLPPDGERFATVLDRLRTDVEEATGCATTLGYGPRYLHSTGQLHKGGPTSGAFVIITASPDVDVPVPGEPYSFGVLENAQASGDFAALEEGGRRALRVHLPRRDPALLEHFADGLVAGLGAAHRST